MTKQRSGFPTTSEPGPDTVASGDGVGRGVRSCWRPEPDINACCLQREGVTDLVAEYAEYGAFAREWHLGTLADYDVSLDEVRERGDLDLLPPVNGWDFFASVIPEGMPTEGSVPTVLAVLRFAGSASAHFAGVWCAYPLPGYLLAATSRRR